MKIIDREMTSKISTSDKSNTMCDCQASFNSDGYITLRNYNIKTKNSDEIIVFSAEETQAIIELFVKIANLKNRPLPF